MIASFHCVGTRPNDDVVTVLAALISENPYNTSDEGTDFYRHFDISGADFTCIHLWVDNWGVQPEAQADFVDKWISRHATLSAKLKKPLIVMEFGTRLNGPGRVAHFDKVQDGAMLFASGSLDYLSMSVINSLYQNEPVHGVLACTGANSTLPE